MHSEDLAIGFFCLLGPGMQEGGSGLGTRRALVLPVSSGCCAGSGSPPPSALDSAALLREARPALTVILFLLPMAASSRWQDLMRILWTLCPSG